MKIWINSRGWPWPVEKYRYPVEQMLITMFPEEKFEFRYDEPPLTSDMEIGDMEISFDMTDTSMYLDDSSTDGTAAKIYTSVNLSANAGPDVSEEPDIDKDYWEWYGWNNYDRRGDRNLAVEVCPEQVVRSEEEAYHAASHAAKLGVYCIGVELLCFSGKRYSFPWGCLTGVRPVKLPTRAMLAGKTPEEAKKELLVQYHVSESRAALAVECAKSALDVKQSLTNDGMALYIGIPFCPTRCAYCSFISADVKRSLTLVEPYVDALCREIELAGSLLRERGLHISTAYMGGGTPTTLSAEQLDKVLSAVENVLPMERCTEFTVEAGRPDTITADKLKTLKSHNIHRISINPQTMEDSVLQAMGRAHTAAQIVEAMELSRQHFGGMVNMDLIAGLPSDTLEGFEQTLDQVLGMDPANITVHTLALKKGSRLTEEGGDLCAPETVESMLSLADQRLRGAGYTPYYLYRQKYMSGSFENVGWAKPGAVCAYNIVMMEELQTVLSLGAGGITKLVDFGHRKITRLNNPKYAKEYLESWDKISAAKRTAAEFQAELAQRGK